MVFKVVKSKRTSGIDSPYGGASIFTGNGMNTYTVSGPSLGGAVYVGTGMTNIGAPIKVSSPGGKK